MNKIESEKKRREKTIARDPIIQKKLEILKRLEEKRNDETKSS